MAKAVPLSLPAPTTDALVNALLKAGPSPCDKHQCAQRARCAQDQLACPSFVHYVETGRTVPPRTYFMKEKPVMQDGRYFLCARTSTTRENFLLAFTELHFG